jgi:hypothetical protein
MMAQAATDERGRPQRSARGRIGARSGHHAAVGSGRPRGFIKRRNAHAEVRTRPSLDLINPLMPVALSALRAWFPAHELADATTRDSTGESTIGTSALMTHLLLCPLCFYYHPCSPVVAFVQDGRIGIAAQCCTR